LMTRAWEIIACEPFLANRTMGTDMGTEMGIKLCS